MLVTYRIESTSNWLRLINLSAKRAGERSAGNLHAPFDVAGDGKQLTVRLVRHSQRKRGAPDRSDLRSMAPFLDPTRGQTLILFRTMPSPSIQSLTPEPCSCIGQERSRENTALAAEPRCAPDSNSRKDTPTSAGSLKEFLAHITTPKGWPLLMCDWEACTTATTGLPNPNQRSVAKTSGFLHPYIYRYAARAFLRERILAHEGEGITWIGQPSQESCYFQCA